MGNVVANSADLKLIEQLRAIHSSSCYNELIALSQKSSLLSRIEKDDSETILSKFLRNVFDDVVLNRSIPIAPMGLLLRYIASKLLEKGQISPLNIALLTNPKVDVETSYIKTEEIINKLTKGKKKGRIDVFARGKINFNNNSDGEQFCLVIENKIKTDQHDNQCQDYFDYIEKEYHNIPHRFYVFLDPKEGRADCDAYINMSYNDLMLYILDPLLSEIKHLGSKIPDDYQRDLLELINTLQHPAKFMADQPIALSKEYRELLHRFYDENRELILLAAKEYANDEDFNTIEDGYEQRKSHIIHHPKISDDVHTNQKGLLEALFKQYEKLNWNFDSIHERYKDLGTLYKEPGDRTTGYGDEVEIGGRYCRISTQLGRKDRKFDNIVKIAKEDGFIIH